MCERGDEVQADEGERAAGWQDVQAVLHHGGTEGTEVEAGAAGGFRYAPEYLTQFLEALCKHHPCARELRVSCLWARLPVTGSERFDREFVGAYQPKAAAMMIAGIDPEMWREFVDEDGNPGFESKADWMRATLMVIAHEYAHQVMACRGIIIGPQNEAEAEAEAEGLAEMWMGELAQVVERIVREEMAREDGGSGEGTGLTGVTGLTIGGGA